MARKGSEGDIPGDRWERGQLGGGGWQGGAVRGIYQGIGGRGDSWGGGGARKGSEGDIPGDRWERGTVGGRGG